MVPKIQNLKSSEVQKRVMIDTVLKRYGLQKGR